MTIIDEQNSFNENMKIISISTTTPKQTEIVLQEDQCFDRLDDCIQKKEYGFCAMLNEKYPNDCAKTCHPDCNFLS